MSPSPMIFDRQLLHVRQSHARALGPATFLLDRAATELAERLSAVVRRFELAVDLGTPTDAVRRALAASGKIGAIVAAADPATLRAHARARGWHNLRLLSAGNNTFKYDFRSEDAEGRQDSALSVFTCDHAGSLRHFYTTHPWLDEDVNERGIDLLQPVYNMLDLTPQGRGNWYASLGYGTRVDWVPHTR